MHPDLLALLAADDEANVLVRDAGRRLEEKLRAARESRVAERARLQQQRAGEIERLVRAVEEQAHTRAGDREAARARLREARSAAAGGVRGAGIEAYLEIVRGARGAEPRP